MQMKAFNGERDPAKKKSFLFVPATNSNCLFSINLINFDLTSSV